MFVGLAAAFFISCAAGVTIKPFISCGMAAGAGFSAITGGSVGVPVFRSVACLASIPIDWVSDGFGNGAAAVCGCWPSTSWAAGVPAGGQDSTGLSVGVAGVVTGAGL